MTAGAELSGAVTMVMLERPAVHYAADGTTGERLPTVFHGEGGRGLVRSARELCARRFQAQEKPVRIREDPSRWRVGGLPWAGYYEGQFGVSVAPHDTVWWDGNSYGGSGGGG